MYGGPGYDHGRWCEGYDLDHQCEAVSRDLTFEQRLVNASYKDVGLVRGKTYSACAISLICLVMARVPSIACALCGRVAEATVI